MTTAAPVDLPSAPGGAPLDWITTYEAARAGAFGGNSQDVIDRLLKDSPSYQNLVDRGVISRQTTHMVATDGDMSEQPYYTDSSVDWSQLPAIAGGMKLPENYMWSNIAHDGRPGIDADSASIVYKYNDPNYGELGLVQKRIPLTPMESMMRSLVIGAATGPIIGAAAGAMGAAAGLGTFGTGVLGAGMKLGLSAAISGQAPNPFNAIFSILKPSATQVVKDTMSPLMPDFPKLPSLGELGQMTDLSNISLPSMPDLGSIFAGF